MISSALAKLLVLTARPHLNTEQEARALVLCAADINWPQFIQLAEAKQSLPLAYRNLSALQAGGPPTQFREEMHRRSVSMALAALRMMAAQIQFQKACLDACGADYAYIKGSVIAAAYYGDVGLRFARDIDILVRETAIPEVVFQALGSGYTMDLMGQSASHCSEADIFSILLQEGAVTLHSPDGIPIELHKCLGKDGFTYFSSDKILRNKCVISIGGMPSNMLHINDLFPYICYHHSGHYWSRLHWLADLDAMISHPSFSATDVLASAKQYRLQETIEACLALNRLSSDVEGWDNGASPERGKQLLRACLTNLAGGIDVEFDMRRSIYAGWFAFEWQRTTTTSWQIITQKIRQLFSSSGFSHNQRRKMGGVNLATPIHRITKYIFRTRHRKGG